MVDPLATQVLPCAGVPWWASPPLAVLLSGVVIAGLWLTFRWMARDRRR